MKNSVKLENSFNSVSGPASISLAYEDSQILSSRSSSSGQNVGSRNTLNFTCYQGILSETVMNTQSLG